MCKNQKNLFEFLDLVLFTLYIFFSVKIKFGEKIKTLLKKSAKK